MGKSAQLCVVNCVCTGATFEVPREMRQACMRGFRAPVQRTFRLYPEHRARQQCKFFWFLGGASRASVRSKVKRCMHLIRLLYTGAGECGIVLNTKSLNRR